MKPVRGATVPGFFDIVEVLGRGPSEEWRELYFEAKRNPELRRKIQLILEFLGPDYADATAVWSGLLAAISPHQEAAPEPAMSSHPTSHW